MNLIDKQRELANGELYKACNDGAAALLQPDGGNVLDFQDRRFALLCLSVQNGGSIAVVESFVAEATGARDAGGGQ